jgi:hypothetical protein
MMSEARRKKVFPEKGAESSRKTAANNRVKTTVAVI